jgi:uncharacterized protein (TIGR03437 family)
VRPTNPGIFRLGASSYAVVLNEDGTVNAPDNPAARGSLISLWATGMGRLTQPVEDGAIQSAASPLELPVRAVFSGSGNAEVLYAGAAPGMVAGVSQINLRVPTNIAGSSRVPLSLYVGSDSVIERAFVAVK